MEYQLQYNAGNPRAYIGNGTNRFFMFDGTDIAWSGANTSLTTSGLFTAANANITGAITATSGSLSSLTVSGLLSLATTGELRAGNTTNGLRLGYLTDGYYLRGVGGGNTQVEIRAADGKLYAGNGAVVLDSAGISIISPSSQSDPGAIKFKTGSVTSAQLYSTSSYYTELSTIATGTNNAEVKIRASASGTGTFGYARLRSSCTGIAEKGLSVIADQQAAHVRAEFDTAYIYNYGSLANAGGINVGTATGAATGDVKMSGSIRQSTALGCRVYHSATQTLNNATLTALSFNTEVNDTDNCFVPTSTALYARTAGYYVAGGSFAHTIGGNWYETYIYIRRNGSMYLACSSAAHNWNGTGLAEVATGMFYLAVNDYIEVIAYQNSGGSKTVNAADGSNQFHCMGWLMRVA